MEKGWKRDSSGGLEAKGRYGEEVVVSDRIKDRSLWILSVKNFANDWGKEPRLKDEGNEGLAILFSSLLIVFHQRFFWICQIWKE